MSAVKRLRIDYTIYSPNYALGAGECWDYLTFRRARKKARELGVGSVVIRNFNKEHPLDWWQTPFCWVWDGCDFRKARSLQEKKWEVEQSDWSHARLLKQFRSKHR